jgi:diguanylate cyclase (GGDEF)-like protein
MPSRVLRQSLYALALTGVTVWLLLQLTPRTAPPLLAALGAFAFLLFSWHRGIPTRFFGLLSLERIPQVAAVLAFGTLAGACVNGLASLVFPFTNRAYSQGSLRIAALRGVHNAAMSALMSVAGGTAYDALGGARPLLALDLEALLPLAGLALAMQLVNMVMMATFFWLDARDLRRMFTPAYALTDFLIVPLGALTAVLYVRVDVVAFLLFVVVLVAFALALERVARARVELEARIDTLDKAAAAGSALAGASRIDALAERVKRQVDALFRYDELYLVFLDEATDELDFRLHVRDGQPMPRRRKLAGAGLFGWVAQRGEPLLITDWREAPRELLERAIPTAYDSLSLMIVPMRHAGSVVGLLSVQHREPRVWDEADLHLISAIGERIAASLSDARLFEELEEGRQSLELRVAERTAELAAASAEREQLVAELKAKTAMLERQSMEDALTGLANRRKLDEQVVAELARAVRFAHPVTVALADLDHFKRVNDEYGHAIGDEVLRVSAALLRRHCRGIDIVARYGGEEFALVLPETDLAGARVVCEKIRTAFVAHAWGTVAPRLMVSISIGLFEAQSGMDAAGVFERADANLYEAKRSGRDRVVG